MNKNILMSLVVAVLIGGGALVWFSKKDSGHVTPSSTTQTSETDSSAALQLTTTDSTKTPAATITYSDSGFSPAKTTVKSGDVVKVVNNSSRALEFSSDPHPVHTKDTDLNQQTLRPGESQTFSVTKKGTFGFHDHLDATKTGTITIE